MQPNQPHIRAIDYHELAGLSRIPADQGPLQRRLLAAVCLASLRCCLCHRHVLTTGFGGADGDLPFHSCLSHQQELLTPLSTGTREVKSIREAEAIPV